MSPTPGVGGAALDTVHTTGHPCEQEYASTQSCSQVRHTARATHTNKLTPHCVAMPRRNSLTNRTKILRVAAQRSPLVAAAAVNWDSENTAATRR